MSATQQLHLPLKFCPPGLISAVPLSAGPSSPFSHLNNHSLSVGAGADLARVRPVSEQGRWWRSIYLVVKKQVFGGVQGK